ncbi:hypothetical protein BC941DRAFT_513586 [Chlamydoabsidia padenii]|nr:hypothetical protein BC941DRAFT_513586 [Chlamydoabsidia padenii]
MISSIQQDTWSEDLQLPTSHGFLKHDILERICRFLPTQQDCYQACLINRAWRYPATNVLWESPVFRSPTSFKLFLKIIDEKRLALNVRHLTLCLPDTTSSNLFEPVNQSEQDRHLLKDNIMSRTHVIHHVIQYCQQLTSLTVYGWNLEQYDFDKLYSFLPWLKNLKVIGANCQFLQQAQQQRQSQQSQQTVTNFQLNTYLPRLYQLVLDGLFPISKAFAHSIAMKAQNLSTLHLSLYSMNPVILSALCSSDTALDLKDLTLTHGTHMNDHFTSKVLARFSNLRKFRLDGTQHLTANILRLALESCRYLQHLEIRQSQRGIPLAEGTDQEDWQLTYENGADIRTLLVENLHLYNSTLDNIAYYCPLLTSLGLAHTGADLTDMGIEALAKGSFRFLRHVYLQDCPMVTSEAIVYLPMPSLYTLYLESVGKIEPIDIFNICSYAVEEATENNLRPNLRQIQVVGHENIATSAVGAHAIERLDYQAKQWVDESAAQDSLQSSNYKVTLDQQAIDSLAHSDEFIVVPSSRFLTGQQIVDLAKELQVPLNHLVSLLDGLKEPEPGHITGPNHIPEPKESKSRMNILKKSTSHNLRPSTPALWAAAGNDPDTLPPQKPNVPSTGSDQLNSTSPTPSSPLHPESHSGSTTFDASSAHSQTSDYEYEQVADDKEDWVEGDTTETTTNISLGGWGTTDNIPWNTKSKGTTFSSAVAGNLSTKSNKMLKSSSNNESSNGGVGWGNTTGENYESYWRTTPVEQPPRLSKQKGRLTNLDVGTDQWGQVSKFVNWKDVQPFAGDVLDNQHKTVYWGRRQDGEWQPLQNGDQQINNNDTDRDGDGVDQNTTITKFSRRSSSSLKPISTSKMDVTTKGYSLSSDDSDVDWDDDDGITIKLGNGANTPHPSRNSRENRRSSTPLNKSSWKEKKLGQESPLTNTTWDGTKVKTTGREPRTTRFARPKTIPSTPTVAPLTASPAPLTTSSAVTTPTPGSSTITPMSPPPASANTTLSPTKVDGSSKSNSINRWQEFADNKKVKTSASSTTSPMTTDLLLTSNDITEEEEDMSTTLLVDTSDNTAVIGASTWALNEKRSALYDIYESMADIQINSDNNDDNKNNNNNNDTMKLETISWSEEQHDGNNTYQDDRWPIARDQVKNVDSNDILLLLDSSPTNDTINNKGKSSGVKVNDTDSTINTPTTLLDPPTTTTKEPSILVGTLIDRSILVATTNNAPSDDLMTASGNLLDTTGDLPLTNGTLAPPPPSSPPTESLKVTSNVTTTADTIDETSGDATDVIDETSGDAADVIDETSGDAADPVADEKGYFLRLGLQIPNGKQEILCLFEHRDPKIDVHRFCQQHDMLRSEEYIYEHVNKAYMKKKADMLLGGGLKKKKKKKKKDKKETKSAS